MSDLERDIICISRSLAAGGEEIGRLVAKKTGFRYVGDEIVAEAAEELGISIETMQEVERTTGPVGRMLEYLSWAPLPVGYTTLSSGQPTTPKHLIQRVVLETGGEGKVVIVAHGGSYALAGREQLLRVLVTASPAVRVERLVMRGDLAEGEANKVVEESDSQRKGYLRRFYDVREELPTHYDLVINTDHLSPDAAAQLIVSAARG